MRCLCFLALLFDFGMTFAQDSHQTAKEQPKESVEANNNQKKEPFEIAKEKAKELSALLATLAFKLRPHLSFDESYYIGTTSYYLFFHAHYEPALTDKEMKKRLEKVREALVKVLPQVEKMLSLLPQPAKKEVFLNTFWFKDPKERDEYYNTLLDAYKKNKGEVLKTAFEILQVLEKNDKFFGSDRKEKRPTKDLIHHYATMLILAIKDNRTYDAGYYLGELIKAIKRER